ncbi:MAG: hypothetical protein NZM65_01815 [Flavobacteriales bacterium]|nr:hypothetical protein [Flavobacteriales bacterium]MDW8409405.1 hypothetical protein [Flavobacteriales bacterium]
MCTINWKPNCDRPPYEFLTTHITRLRWLSGTVRSARFAEKAFGSNLQG